MEGNSKGRLCFKKLQIYPTKDYFSTYLHSALTGDGERNNLALLSTMNESFADDKNADKKMKLKFVCPSATFAKHLWRHILSQQVFFTEEQARFVKPIFSKPRILFFLEDQLSVVQPAVCYMKLSRIGRAVESLSPTSVPSTPKSSRPSEVVANVDTGVERPKIFTGDGALAEMPILSVDITNTTTTDGAFGTTTTTSPHSFSPTIATADTGDKEQQEAARCIMESSLDGLPNEHQMVHN
uniref:Uncharacterized protein n=1 Tax=Ditylenchus dipsaci TaxID=166011 RepID=A0A915E6X8_9BILA